MSATPAEPGGGGASTLALVKRIEGVVLDKSKATASFVVDGRPDDDGEFEFVAIARVPSLDVSKTNETPLAATLRRDQRVLSLEMKAIGDTPLAGEKVVAIDPDSGEPVSEPVEADDSGKVTIPVPEDKNYHLKIVDDTPAIGGHKDEPGDDHDTSTVLACRFHDAGGAPIAGEKVQISGEGGFTFEASTGDQGEIEPSLDAGAYEVEIRGEKFNAHTLRIGQLSEGGEHYHFRLGAAGGEHDDGGGGLSLADHIEAAPSDDDEEKDAGHGFADAPEE